MVCEFANAKMPFFYTAQKLTDISIAYLSSETVICAIIILIKIRILQ